MKKIRTAYPLYSMGFLLLTSITSLSFTLPLLPASAEDHEHYLSVVPPAGSVKPPAKTAPAAAPSKSAASAEASKPSGSAASAPKTPADTETSTEAQPGADVSVPGETPPPPKSFYSANLDQAVRLYKATPSGQTYSQVLQALKSCLAASGGLRLSPTILVKDNPYLNDFRPRVLEANGIRLWTFPRAPERNRALIQWFDVHQQVIGVGRRKKVVSSTSVRFQEMVFARELTVKDAGMVTLKESGRRLVLAGDAEDGSLAIVAYKMTETGWQEEPDFHQQLPAFLSNNVCGRVGFRGSDLIFNVGKMISVTDSTGAKRWLPEAESATYKFLLKNTDTGYQVSTSMPNEEPFSAVFQFMQAVAQSRTDTEKALMADPKSASPLLSIPKYLGLQGRQVDSATKVVEMSVPASRGNRFRLINMGKDDLIFDVGKIKNQWLIKAIFIAPPDPFLAETARYYPHFSRFEQKPEPPKEPSEAGAGTSSPAVKRK